MRRDIRPTVVLLLLLTVLTGALYPLVVTGAAQALFPWRANGSLIERGGVVVGSELIGQPFADPRYFWPRPSATSPACNGAASGGSNLGPTNPAFLAAVRARVEALGRANPDAAGLPPVDLVTASASGLDPHVSPAAALWQVPRVAKARGLPAEELRALALRHVERSAGGVLGPAHVNVLRLNLALDEWAGGRPVPAPRRGQIP